MADEPKIITEAQRVALRLVAKGYESKEIARQVGVGHHAIDKRIERAVRLMGASDRKEAARMLMLEESSTYERTAYEPTDMDFPGSDGIVPPSDSAGVTAFPWP
jgi:DNA-binding CsgD family transcriptional regulator